MNFAAYNAERENEAKAELDERGMMMTTTTMMMMLKKKKMMMQVKQLNVVTLEGDQEKEQVRYDDGDNAAAYAKVREAVQMMMMMIVVMEMFWEEAIEMRVYFAGESDRGTH